MNDLIIAAIFLAIIVFIAIGITCQRSGEKYGRKVGYRDGRADGGDQAHRRIAATLDVSRESLSVALVNIEAAKSLQDRRAALEVLLKKAA